MTPPDGTPSGCHVTQGLTPVFGRIFLDEKNQIEWPFFGTAEQAWMSSVETRPDGQSASGCIWTRALLDDAIMPAVDYRMAEGMSFDELSAWLAPAVASGRFTGIEIAIFNPHSIQLARSPATSPTPLYGTCIQRGPGPVWTASG